MVYAVQQQGHTSGRDFVNAFRMMWQIITRVAHKVKTLTSWQNIPRKSQTRFMKIIS